MHVAMDTHADGSASIFFTTNITLFGKLRNRENFSTQKFRLYPINIYNKTFKMENFCALPTTSSPIVVLIMKQEILQWLNVHG